MADCRKCTKFETCAVEEDCFAYTEKQITNADRIRSMTDEELAEFIAGGIPSAVCKGMCVDGSYPCNLCVLEWLKQECE